MCHKCVPRSCINCLRVCILITAVLLLAFGGVGIWFGFEFKKEHIVKAFYLQPVGDGIMGFGGFLILTGIIGLFVGFLKWRICVVIYFLIQIFLAVILIGSSGALIYGREWVSDKMENRDKCRDYDELKTVDDFISDAATQFCGLPCPCDGCDNKDLDHLPKECKSGSAKSILKCVPCESAKDTKIHDWIVDQAGSNKIAKWCDEHDMGDPDDYLDVYFDAEKRHYKDLLIWIEDHFDCSGLCTKQGLYLFTNINRGNPHEGCLIRLKDWARKWFLIFGIINGCFGIWMIILSISSCCICCQKKRLGLANMYADEEDVTNNSVGSINDPLTEPVRK